MEPPCPSSAARTTAPSSWRCSGCCDRGGSRLKPSHREQTTLARGRSRPPPPLDSVGAAYRPTDHARRTCLKSEAGIYLSVYGSGGYYLAPGPLGGTDRRHTGSMSPKSLIEVPPYSHTVVYCMNQGNSHTSSIKSGSKHQQFDGTYSAYNIAAKAHTQ